MELEGSCHCGAVHFRVDSTTPVPYQRCYCAICRKTQGGGGYAINIGADASTLKVRGQDDISIYHAKMKSGHERAHTSTAERHFCRRCGSALWLFSPEWPELIHPFASAIDTPLPTAAQHTHMMLASKAPWVEIAAGPRDKHFDQYPEESLEVWHQRVCPGVYS